MKTVATFRDAPQAHLAKGRLEADGIPAILVDEYLVEIDWMYSQAIGGIKIQVSEIDYQRAREILQDDFSEELKAIYAKAPEEVCPRCGSTSISRKPYSLWMIIPSLIFLLPIFFRRKNWKCGDCGALW